MRSITSKDAILIAGIIVGLLAVAFLSPVLEAKQTSVSSTIEEEDLSLQGGKLKGYALGFEGLIADWYWMRSLQYIGGKLHDAKDIEINLDNLRPLNPKLLYPLLDNAATLDPQFMAVYSYGANVLPAIDKSQAIAIIKKGIKNNPDEWRLYHQLGFIYWKLGDYKNASAIYAQGSQIKKAPPWMKIMSARMESSGGTRETAREIYLQLFQGAADTQTKTSAEIRLRELDSFDEIDALNHALSEFKSRNGRCAKQWSELHQLLELEKLPNDRDFRIDASGNVVDPTDAPYLIEPKSCISAPDYSKSKLPRTK